MKSLFYLTLLLALFDLTGCRRDAKRDPYDWYSNGGDYTGVSPSISRDGNQIVYSSPKSGHGDLYLWNAKTKSTVRLTDDPDYEGYPNISPDGLHIAFIKTIEDTDTLWVMDTHLKTSREVISDVSCRQPVFSSDGQYIAYLQEDTVHPKTQELFVLNLNTLKRYRVPNISSATDPSWSPTRDKIYYCAGSADQPQIRKVDMDGSNNSLVGSGFSPAISPDNKQIAFLSGSNQNEVWLMNSKDLRFTLLDSSNTPKESLRFHPDNSHVIFLDDISREKTEIVIMDTKTGRKTIVPN